MLRKYRTGSRLPAGEGRALRKKGGKKVGAANLLASSDQDVDFFIHGVFSYELFGQTFWITTTHVAIAIVMLLIVIFAVAARIAISHAEKYPTGFQNIVEMIVEMLDKMVESSMGPYAKKFRNYIGSIFIFIFLSNISGLFGLRPPTADYGVTLPLGLLTFGIIQYNNMIGEIATPFSLSLRLFGNVLSGTVMMSLIYTLLAKFAIGWPGFLHIYFDVFSGAIQTYVFCMLTMVYVTDKLPEVE